MRDLINLQIRQYFAELRATPPDFARDVNGDRTIRAGIVLMSVTLTTGRLESAAAVTNALLAGGSVEIEIVGETVRISVAVAGETMTSFLELRFNSLEPVVH